MPGLGVFRIFMRLSFKKSYDLINSHRKVLCLYILSKCWKIWQSIFKEYPPAFTLAFAPADIFLWLSQSGFEICYHYTFIYSMLPTRCWSVLYHLILMFCLFFLTVYILLSYLYISRFVMIFDHLDAYITSRLD